MSNYGNSDAGRLNDLQSVTQKLREPWPDSTFPSHKYNKSYCMRVTKGRRNPNFGKKLPSNPRAKTCRAQAFVPHPPPLFSSWEKVPPSPRPLDWEQNGGRVFDRAPDPQNCFWTHPFAGTGCGYDPFGVLPNLTPPRKRLCNNFREGGELSFPCSLGSVGTSRQGSGF